LARAVIAHAPSLQDPFEDYKVRLAARLSKLDQSEEAQRKRAAAAAEREKDRTTWLGTDLGEKGESSAVREERKRKADDAGVGKYLGAGASKKKPPTSAPASGASTPTPAAPQQFGIDKKKRKAGGGFGDFSAW
jgi:peptidyl-prolyl cis-trans isomerase-like protein 2